MSKTLVKKTATYIAHLPDWNGEAQLFKLNSPIHAYCANEDADGGYDYVVVSAVNAYGTGRPETYIFAADQDGNVLDWLELPGSFQGALDHHKALQDAGYEVVA